MFFRNKMNTKINSRNNSNKQSVKSGAVKNSTIEVNASGNDSTVSVILAEVLKIGTRLDKIESKQSNMHKAFNHYVKHNGVKPQVKAEVKAMLDLD